MDGATLARAMGCSRALADRYIDGFNQALIQAQCTTVNRAAMFCAQTGHESLGFRYLEEIASGAAYEGRKDLGNTRPGFGRRYKGRGIIQTTGAFNYQALSRWAHAQRLVNTATYFYDNPHLVAEPPWAFISASWYWTVARPTLNRNADAGALETCTRQINGGLNGLADRRTRWNRCRGLGAAILPTGGAGPGPAAAPAPAPAAPPRRRSRRESRMLYFKSPEPAPGTPKKDWPTILVPYRFDPIGGWGGKCILNVDWFGRGGWLKSGQWWVRDPNWSANRPIHFPVEHPVGAGGSERFVGFGWETAPPLRADSIQITTSCPDGLILDMTYEK